MRAAAKVAQRPGWLRAINVKTMKDISSEQDVAELLDIFYARIREHPELGPIFIEDIGALWELHMDTLNRFWCTLLFEGKKYFGKPLDVMSINLSVIR